MAKLTSMMNIGRELERKLTSVGIGSAEELLAAGSEQVYPQVCLVHLYALEGAVSNTEFHSLPDGKKKELKAFSDSLK